MEHKCLRDPLGPPLSVTVNADVPSSLVCLPLQEVSSVAPTLLDRQAADLQSPRFHLDEAQLAAGALLDLGDMEEDSCSDLEWDEGVIVNEAPKSDVIQVELK